MARIPLLTLDATLLGDGEMDPPIFYERFVHQMAELLAEYMEEEAPVGRRLVPPRSTRARRHTGLRESIQVLAHPRKGSGRDAVAFVGATDHVAKFVVRGTSPHRIEARRAKVLAIPSASADGSPWSFRKRVMHPGTRPNDFIKRAGARVTRQDILRTVQRVDRSLKVP